MARTRTTFGTVRSNTDGSSGGQLSPEYSGSPPNMEDEGREIERKMEEMRQQLMAEAMAKKREERRKQKDAAEAEKLRIENERLEREAREQEEERVRRQEDFDREMLMQQEENEIRRQDELRERAKEDKMRKELRKRQAERLRKGKMAAADVNYEPEEDEEVGEAEHITEEISPPVRKNPTKTRKTKQTEQAKGAEEPLNYRQEFAKIGFKSTRYPDMNTAKKLGISEDVESLIAGCGLGQYMSMTDVTYPEAAAEFLATVRYSEVKGSLALLNSMGGGFITFQTNGEEYTCTLKEIQEYFGFPSGKPNQHSIAKEEQNSLWELITGNKTFEHGAKGSKIRSPTVAYVRRAIAETLYSRDKTGPCSTGDLNVLIGGLKAVFIENPSTREVIDGDRANAGLAYILAKQLESYRGKISSALKRGTVIAKLNIGGPITRILRLAGVEIDSNAEHYEPARMDIDYLRAQRLLTGPKKDPRFYYRLHLEDQTETLIALPNEDITSFEDPMNVIFIPFEELFIDPESLEPSSNLPDIEQAGSSSSTKKKKGTPAVKEKMLKMVPCLMTKEQRDELKAEIRGELEVDISEEVEERLRQKIRAEVIEEVEERLTQKIRAEVTKEMEETLTKKWARKMKEHFSQIERLFVKKPASGGSSTSVPPRHPPSESGSKRPPGGSGPEGRQQKIPRQRSPPEGDKDSTLPRDIPPIRLNISSRNRST